jgi:hypothetical protein
MTEEDTQSHAMILEKGLENTREKTHFNQQFIIRLRRFYRNFTSKNLNLQ